MQTTIYKKKLVAGPLALNEVDKWKALAAKANVLYYGEGDVKVSLTAGRVVYVNSRYFVELTIPDAAMSTQLSQAVRNMHLAIINNGTKDILVENNTMYYLLSDENKEYKLGTPTSYYRCVEYAENLAAYHPAEVE